MQAWIVGKWITPREQSWAPRGAHFHQFVVPPILHFRRDCTYGDLAAMKLPQDVQGLGSCEVIRHHLFHKLHTSSTYACMLLHLLMAPDDNPVGQARKSFALIWSFVSLEP